MRARQDGKEMIGLDGKREDGLCTQVRDAPMRTRLKRTTAKCHSYNKHHRSRIRLLQVDAPFNSVRESLRCQYSINAKTYP